MMEKKQKKQQHRYCRRRVNDRSSLRNEVRKKNYTQFGSENSFRGKLAVGWNLDKASLPLKISFSYVKGTFTMV